MKKFKITLIAIALLSLSGCGYISRLTAHYTGYSIICVKETGVQYIQFTSGAAVLVDKDGKPQTCKE